MNLRNSKNYLFEGIDSQSKKNYNINYMKSPSNSLLKLNLFQDQENYSIIEYCLISQKTESQLL